MSNQDGKAAASLVGENNKVNAGDPLYADVMNALVQDGAALGDGVTDADSIRQQYHQLRQSLFTALKKQQEEQQQPSIQATTPVPGSIVEEGDEDKKMSAPELLSLQSSPIQSSLRSPKFSMGQEQQEKKQEAIAYASLHEVPSLHALGTEQQQQQQSQPGTPSTETDSSVDLDAPQQTTIVTADRAGSRKPSLKRGIQQGGPTSFVRVTRFADKFPNNNGRNTSYSLSMVRPRVMAQSQSCRLPSINSAAEPNSRMAINDMEHAILKKEELLERNDSIASSMVQDVPPIQEGGPAQLLGVSSPMGVGAFAARTIASHQPSWASYDTDQQQEPSDASGIVYANHDFVGKPIIVAEKVVEENPRKKLLKWILLVLGALILALAVGLAVGLTRKGVVTLVTTQPACDITDDIVAQCRCNNSIYHIPDGLLPQYNNITNALTMAGVAMDIGLPTSSCAPSVVSRFFLATLPPMDERDLRQKFALFSFHYALNGSDWATVQWNFTESICDDFEGILCSDEGDVEEIFLRGDSVAGQLPSEVVAITTLKNLQLSNNKLTGTIPLEFGRSRIQRLILESNKLTGQFNTNNLPVTLNVLRLSENRFTGTMPTSIGQFTKLRRFFIDNNDLRGKLPTEIGLLKRLNRLDLSYNQFSGTLPSEFSNLDKMQFLYLQGNMLTGNLPTSWQAGLGRLRQLAVFENDLNTTFISEDFCQSLEGEDPPELVLDCDNVESGCSCCLCSSQFDP